MYKKLDKIHNILIPIKITTITTKYQLVHFVIIDFLDESMESMKLLYQLSLFIIISYPESFDQEASQRPQLY